VKEATNGTNFRAALREYLRERLEHDLALLIREWTAASHL
jgi:hypothetical protein